MTIVDARGRLFGRFNLIDTALALLVLILVPTAYAAWLLFRVPPPTITSVEPEVLEVADSLRIRIHGENLLPYLTAYVGRSGEPVAVLLDDQTSSLARFLIETPKTGVLLLPPLKPGRYDIYLYSEARQLAHKAEAFTVRLPPEEEPKPAPPPTRSVATVTVHYILPREYADRPRVGDRDRFGSPTLSGEPDARLLTLARRVAPPSVTNIADPVLIVATVRVPVSKTPEGLWWYKGQRMRAGEWLAFGDVDYYIYGLIVDVSVPDEAPWDEQ